MVSDDSQIEALNSEPEARNSGPIVRRFWKFDRRFWEFYGPRLLVLLAIGGMVGAITTMTQVGIRWQPWYVVLGTVLYRAGWGFFLVSVFSGFATLSSCTWRTRPFFIFFVVHLLMTVFLVVTLDRTFHAPDAKGDFYNESQGFEPIWLAMLRDAALLNTFLSVLAAWVGSLSRK